MTPLKEIIAPFQTDVQGYLESVKRRKRETCSHQFVSYPIIDHQNDRIDEIRVCRKCGYESP